MTRDELRIVLWAFRRLSNTLRRARVSGPIDIKNCWQDASSTRLLFAPSKV